MIYFFLAFPYSVKEKGNDEGKKTKKGKKGRERKKEIIGRKK